MSRFIPTHAPTNKLQTNIEMKRVCQIDFMRDPMLDFIINENSVRLSLRSYKHHQQVCPLQALNSEKISEMFCPPNPKLFDNAR